MSQNKIEINHVVPIMHNGMISSPNLAEGRLLPILVINAVEFPGISDLIKMHLLTTSGDTKVTWGRSKTLFKPKEIFLHLEFIKPLEITFAIVFQLTKEFSLIDGIIQSRGFFLQAGKPGDRARDINGENSILIEVPDVAFDNKWNALLAGTLSNNYRREGYSKKESLKMSSQQIRTMREVWHIRRPKE
ncbi:hypothetical protein [Chryseolinea soli]|uniref:Uncharacterized protein n=1 Tax=Chryseolinea soli TaxID=2321403 RepID=A0A385SJ99_9BACT|nr:hypothetical protein [Chryseolinea soli]AYB30972.1 hypothetical protein D4L85_10445 [Chryseolinea soli]